MKYIDADKLRAEIKGKIAELESEPTPADRETILLQMCRTNAFREVLSVLNRLEKNSLQQEQPNDLASLISEATTVAKRIVDRDSFYNSLPQNLRNKYTFNAWCEILGALSMMKEQEQPEPSCKTCGFYENNCPFIRDTFKPYPNKVCKDYTYSVMKEHEQPEVDLEEEMQEEYYK